MACPDPSASEPQFVTPQTLNGELYDHPTGGGWSFYQDSLSNLNSTYFPQEEDFWGSFRTVYNNYEKYYGEDLPYDDVYQNWFGHHEPPLSSCWEDYFSSLQDNLAAVEDEGALQNKTLFQDEGHGDYTYQVEEAKSYDYDLTTEYGYLLAQIWEEIPCESHRPEPSRPFSELGFYESIFGYRPCLFQKEAKAAW